MTLLSLLAGRKETRILIAEQSKYWIVYYTALGSGNEFLKF